MAWRGSGVRVPSAPLGVPVREPAPGTSYVGLVGRTAAGSVPRWSRAAWRSPGRSAGVFPLPEPSSNVIFVTSPRKRPTLIALLVAAMAATTAAVLPVEAVPPSPPAVASTPLPLGAAGLAEQRTTEVLQPGVTLTTIVRGAADGTESWTVEMIVPSGGSDPDPDAPPSALRDRGSAEALAAALTAAGYAARVEEVVTPALHDVAGGTIGFRVRVGSFATLADANVELARLRAAGYSGSSFFTGWDGDD